MAITQEFRDAVAQGEVRTVRIMMKNSLIVDPTFSEYDQMVGLSRDMSKLYDTHDGEVLNYEISAWSKEYMDEQMVQVVSNFSQERLGLLKNICKHLYGARAAKIENERSDAKRQYSVKKTVSKKQIGTGVAIAGVAVAVVGVATSQAIVIGAGVAAAVVGGIVIITDK